MDSRLSFVRVWAIMACAVSLLWPTTAMAVAWPLAEDCEVALAYGQPYTGPDGAARTHTGLDLHAEHGVAALSVVGGTVAFAGRIPAGAGASTLAVTIEAADGLRYTVLPLESLDVGAGDAVEAGTELGALAQGGDDSTASTHLHVSVRRGETYLDPMSVLERPVMVAPEPQPEPPVQAPETPPLDEPVIPVEPAVPPVVLAPVDGASDPAGVQAEPVSVPSALGQTADGRTAPAQTVSAGSPSSVAGSASRPVGSAEAGLWQSNVPTADSAGPALASPAAAARATRVRSCDPLESVSRTRDAAADVPAPPSRAPRVANRHLSQVGAVALCAPALAALWPLFRRRSPVFTQCVIARGDDVAAAVGR
jgi:hypothetical protein